MTDSVRTGTAARRAATAIKDGEGDPSVPRWRESPALRIAVGLLAMASLVSSIGICQIAQAQDDWDAAKKPADRPNQNGVFALPNFDQWVLGGRNRDQIENQLKSLLTLHVESANRACELSAAQREKLRLAGEGDLKRLFGAIDQAREKFGEVGQDQQKLNECYQQASILQTKMQSGVFDESSLYQKVLRQTLNKRTIASL